MIIIDWDYIIHYRVEILVRLHHFLLHLFSEIKIFRLEYQLQVNSILEPLHYEAIVIARQWLFLSSTISEALTIVRTHAQMVNSNKHWPPSPTTVVTWPILSATKTLWSKTSPPKQRWCVETTTPLAKPPWARIAITSSGVTPTVTRDLNFRSVIPIRKMPVKTILRKTVCILFFINITCVI